MSTVLFPSLLNHVMSHTVYHYVGFVFCNVCSAPLGLYSQLPHSQTLTHACMTLPRHVETKLWHDIFARVPNASRDMPLMLHT